MAKQPRFRGKSVQRIAPRSWASALLGVLLFLALDFGAKCLDRWVRPPPPPQIHLSIRVPHPDYDHGIRPKAVGMESYGTQRADYFSNSLGLRDEKVRDVSLNSDLPRFLFMGDSMTEAGPVPWEKTFVGRLQRQWRGRAEILNGAVMDFGPSLILPKLRSLMEKEGLQVNDVVVVLNPSVHRTAFTYASEGDGVVRYHRFGPYQEQAAFLARTEEVGAWLETRIEKKFVLLGALVRNARLGWRKVHPVTRKMDRFKSWVEDENQANEDERKLVLEAAVRTLQSLGQIHEFLGEHHVALSVVYLPWPKGILAAHGDTSMQLEIKHWARKNQVLYLDLTPEFLRHGSPTQVVARYYLKNDNHLTDEGHALVAEALSQRLPLPSTR